MIAKLAILLFAGACLAYPADEQRPLDVAAESGVPQGIPPPQAVPSPQGVPPPEAVPVPAPHDIQPEGQVQGGPVPENDLKTDNTYWYRRSYPIYSYRRSYSYYPRSYSYSYYPSYSYWSPYWW